MVLFKRRRPPNVFTPGQMLQILREQTNLVALLQHNAVWLAVEPRTAWILDMCCTGQLEGGPQMAQEVADTLGLVLPPFQPAPATQVESTMDTQQPAQPPGGDPATALATQPVTTDVDMTDAAEGDSNTAPTTGTHAVPGESSGGPGAGLAVTTGSVPQSSSVQRHHSTPSQAAPEVSTDTTAVLPSQSTAPSPTAAAGTPQPAEHAPASTATPGVSSPAAPAPAATGNSFADHQASLARLRAEQGGGQRGRGGGRGRGGRRRSEVDPMPWLSRPHEWQCVRLTLEETFFLHYVLGCLKVMSPVSRSTGEHAEQTSQLKQLNEQELWDACRAIRANFPTSYAAYHHLKCKGWLPRSGLLYGADFVAYSLHPVAAHSLFAIVLQPLNRPPTPPTNKADMDAAMTQEGEEAGEAHDEEGSTLGEELPGSYTMGWHDLQITSRVISTVVKKFLILYLYLPPTSPGHDTPDCVQHYQVEERLVRRWVPDSCRD